HACDTACDHVLAKAVAMNATAIAVAPCCHHEISTQMQIQSLPLLCNHGILKERMAALITDALRAEMLQQYNYHTDVIEFIDLEHTHKNLLIRAIKKKNAQPADFAAYHELCHQFGLTTTLEQLLKQRKDSLEV